MRRIERGHEREDAHRKKNRRRKCAEESQSRQQADDEISGDDGPRDERRGFIKIVDGALLEIKTAQEHGGGVQRERGEQKKIICAVVRAKTLSPQENRINRA